MDPRKVKISINKDRLSIDVMMLVIVVLILLDQLTKPFVKGNKSSGTNRAKYC